MEKAASAWQRLAGPICYRLLLLSFIATMVASSMALFFLSSSGVPLRNTIYPNYYGILLFDIILTVALVVGTTCVEARRCQLLHRAVLASVYVFCSVFSFALWIITVERNGDSWFSSTAKGLYTVSTVKALWACCILTAASILLSTLHLKNAVSAFLAWKRSSNPARCVELGCVRHDAAVCHRSRPEPQRPPPSYQP